VPAFPHQLKALGCFDSFENGILIKQGYVWSVAVNRDLLPKILYGILCATGVPLRNRLRLCGAIVSCHAANTRLAGAMSTIRFPPYALCYDAFNHCSYQQYYDSGLTHARYFLHVMRLFTARTDLVVCEWGCGPARIIQHLRTLDAGIAELIGTDCHRPAVEWCQQAFDDITFLDNQLAPPLPMPAQSMDVVYCCAVLTHLSAAMQQDWMTEILRVLKPGGLFIGSFQGDGLQERMRPDELARYRAGKAVVRGGGAEGSKNYVAFHSDQQVKNCLLANFATVTKCADAPFVQTIWCATSPRSRATGSGSRESAKSYGLPPGSRSKR
jgi:ubiquinone/menaquinone biosynthesis C-methylase UbiE